MQEVCFLREISKHPEVGGAYLVHLWTMLVTIICVY
jgi:hypothetical protein